MTKTIDELKRGLFQLQALLQVAGVTLDEGTLKEYKTKIYWAAFFEVVNTLTSNALQSVENLQDEVETHYLSCPVVTGSGKEKRGKA